MISNAETAIHKLWELAASFRVYMRQKKYSQAKHCYEVARNVSIFMELPEEEMINLFGSREEPDKPIIGMFSEEEVQKAYQECIKRNLTTENRRYEPIKERCMDSSHAPRAEHIIITQIYYTLRPWKNQVKCGNYPHLQLDKEIKIGTGE